MFLYINHRIKKITTIFLLCLILVGTLSTDIAKAALGRAIGNPSSGGTSTGDYPVQNLVIQTLDGMNNDGTNDVCYAQITWKEPAGGNPKMYGLFGKTYDQYGLWINNDFSKYVGLDIKSYIKENLICGKNYSFTVGTYYSANGTGKTYGKSVVDFTLVKPNKSTDYTLTIAEPVQGSKNGDKCAATINWTGKNNKNLNDPSITYVVVVGANDGTTTPPYESGELPATVKSYSVPGGLTCGKDYTVNVSLYSNHVRMTNRSAGFNISDTGVSKKVSPAPAGVVPIGIILPTVINTNTSLSGESCAEKFCKGIDITNFLSIDANIQSSICQMQCAVLNWFSELIKYVIDNILVKTIM